MWRWNDVHASCGLGEVFCCFSRSSLDFQGHRGRNFARIECFRTVSPVKIHRWERNDVHYFTQLRNEPLLFFLNVIRRISRSHATKAANCLSTWAFADWNFSYNSPMAREWRTKLDMAMKRWHIVLQYHPANFKATLDKKSPILSRIG